MAAAQKTLCNAGFLNFGGQYLGDGEVSRGGGSVTLMPATDSVVSPKVSLGGAGLGKITYLGGTSWGGSPQGNNAVYPNLDGNHPPSLPRKDGGLATDPKESRGCRGGVQSSSRGLSVFRGGFGRGKGV